MNEKLIEEARRVIHAAIPGSGDYEDWVEAIPSGLDRLGDMARAALAVFEKAHVHECEMCRWENGFGARKPLTHTCEKNLSTDDFPHGHPEMDPTDDAQGEPSSIPFYDGADVE